MIKNVLKREPPVSGKIASRWFQDRHYQIRSKTVLFELRNASFVVLSTLQLKSRSTKKMSALKEWLIAKMKGVTRKSKYSTSKNTLKLVSFIELNVNGAKMGIQGKFMKIIKSIARRGSLGVNGVSRCSWGIRLKLIKGGLRTLWSQDKGSDDKGS